MSYEFSSDRRRRYKAFTEREDRRWVLRSGPVRVIKSGQSEGRGMEKVTREQYQARTGRPAHDLELDFESGCLDWVPGMLVECIHCGEFFRFGEELVDAADGLPVCPIGDCDGTFADWFPAQKNRPSDR